MYFIKSGQVEICGDNGIVFVTLSTGAFFGEIALFEACRRTASAKAKGNVELCLLRKEDFNIIMDAYPHVAEKIRQTIRERKEHEQRMKDQKAAEESKKEEEEKRGKKQSMSMTTRSMTESTNRISVIGKIHTSIMSLNGAGGGRGGGGGDGSSRPSTSMQHFASSKSQAGISLISGRGSTTSSSSSSSDVHDVVNNNSNMTKKQL
jgi:hypothetical protein